jgi:hypothetical protein
MANCLSASIRLERFELRFNDSESRTAKYLKDRHPFSSTPAILPALTSFDFKGMCIYLEDLVARIDAVPLLCDLHIQFFKQPTFRTPRLSRFISRAPKLQALNEARVAIFGGTILVTVPSPTQTLGLRVLTLEILHRDWQPSSLARLFTETLSLFLSVEHLYMVFPLLRGRNIENTQWLELLRLFFAVKNLYLSKKSVPRIVPALQELLGERPERVTEVLPALQHIFMEGLRPSAPVHQAIGQFVYARQRRQPSGNPIVVSKWVIGKGVRW